MRAPSTLIGLLLVTLLCFGSTVAAEEQPPVSTPEDESAPVSELKARLGEAPIGMERDAAIAGTADGQLPAISPASWTPVAADDDPLLTTVRIGVLASQIMDLSTTTYGIGTGTVKEANPLMGWAADEPLALASMKLGTAAGLDWTIRKLSKSGHRKTAIILGVALTAASMAVSIHNMNEIRNAQR